MNILFKGKDGSVALMTVVAGADKAEAIRKFLEAHPGEYVDQFEYTGEFPSREFRDAWTYKNGKIVVDESKIS